MSKKVNVEVKALSDYLLAITNLYPDKDGKPRCDDDYLQTVIALGPIVSGRLTIGLQALAEVMFIENSNQSKASYGFLIKGIADVQGAINSLTFDLSEGVLPTDICNSHSLMIQFIRMCPFIELGQYRIEGHNISILEKLNHYGEELKQCHLGDTRALCNAIASVIRTQDMPGHRVAAAMDLFSDWLSLINKMDQVCCDCRSMLKREAA